MQILILGNGFDRASGLPTSYEEFFKWRFNEIKKMNSEIEKNFDNYRDKLYKKTEIARDPYGNLRNDYLAKIIVNIDGVSTSYRLIYNELKEIMINLRMQKINFFDLYFMFNKIKKTNWNNIENEILSIVKGIMSYYIESEVEMQRLTSNSGYTYRSEEFDNRIYKFFIVLFLEQCKEDNYTPYEILLRELKEFEREFQKYIIVISSKIEASQNYKRVYTENYLKLISSNDEIYILNFNYTSIVRFIEIQSKMPKEINVHGIFDQVTIFGIDKKGCDINKDEYMFSKTYRKIEENTDSLPLPNNKDKLNRKQELIFYGHSLSKADYSYFQSLFDLYDIYNQTYLIFKYSIYDKLNSYQIKKEVFKNVVTLLTDYGQTMNNKDHGENLLHKLLLEGRLKLEEVELEDMMYK